MYNEILLNNLRAKGFHGSLEQSWDELQLLTQEKGRILLVEHEPPVTVRRCPSSGISLWVHRGEADVFVGMWAGLIYYLDDVDSIVDLLQDIFHGGSMPQGVTPYVLSREIIDRYSLRHCDSFEVYPDTEEELLQNARNTKPASEKSNDQLVHNLSLVMDSCTKLTNDLFEFRCGSTMAHSRIGPGTSQFTVFMLACWDQSSIEVFPFSMLESVMKAVPCSIYSVGWGLKVHLDDPYYSAKDDADRPETPRNWKPRG